MSLAERLERLDARERRLLGALVAVVAVVLVLAIPLGAAAMVSARSDETDALRDAVEQIQRSRTQIQRASATKQSVQQRYATPAPPLAGLLENWAREIGLEIPESQDRPLVPHGKEFDERSTKIVLRKVGMLKLLKFMEKVEQAAFPLTIERLNIRKRGSEPDSYDVDMIVSTYDRKAKEAKPGKSAAAAAEKGEQQ
jgi:hypothetical protein